MAQNVLQSGTVTPLHVPMWTYAGVIQDAGPNTNFVLGVNGYYLNTTFANLTSATLTNPTITGGTISGVSLSGYSFSNPTVSGGTFTSPTISGGTITNTTITNSTTPYVISVVNYAALRALTTSTAYAVISVEGAVSAGDGGGGNFYYVYGASSGTYSDNGGTIIVPTGGDGSAAYLRIFSGNVNVRWFGAKGDGSTNDRAAMLSADTYASSLGTSNYFPPGTYLTTSSMTLTRDCVFDLGASISISSGTVIFNGSINAAKNIQIFKGAGTFQLPNQRDFVTAEWWGAVADGSTLCSTAINAAQTALTNGGTIQFLDGVYIVNAAITITNKVDLIGAGWGLNPSGRGTIFVPTNTFGNSSSNTMFTINFGSTRTQNFQIQGTSGTSTFNAMATGSNAGLNNFERIDINGCGSGLNIPHGNGMTFRNIRIQGFSQNGIYLGGTTGLYPGDIAWQEIAVIANTGATCVLIDGNTNAQYFHRLECIAGSIGIYIRGSGANQRPGGLFFWDCNVTAQTSYCLSIVKAWQTMIYDSWFGSCTAGPGVIIVASSPTDIDGVLLDGCVIGGNSLHGINYQSGSDVVVNNCQIIGNSQGAANTYGGILVQTNTVGLFQVTGCSIIPFLFNASGTQNYAIYLSGGSVSTSGIFTGRVLIANNTLGGASVAAISDNSSPAGTYKVIANNVTS